MTTLPMAAAAPIRLYLLGHFRLEVHGQNLALPTRKVEALLAYLVLHSTTPVHSREKVAGIFWGDSHDEDARRSLRVALTALRKILGAEALLADRSTLALNPSFALWVDVWAFEAAARAWLANPNQADRVGLDLFTGDLLPRFDDEWLNLPRERLRRIYVAAMHAVVEHLRCQGLYEAALAETQNILAVEPADEAAHRHRMVCAAAMGNRPAAIQYYEACRKALAVELEVEPAPETEALLAWIRQVEPEQPSPGPRRGNLPAALTRIIGRERELADITRALAAPSSEVGAARLLTLTGAGGSGKTRLALEASHALNSRFYDGAWWVELAHLTDENLAPAAVVKALGFVVAPGASSQAALTEFLRPRRLLLILDNCEHVVTACARLLVSLLAACPDLRVLTTSREALNIPGELAYPVSTLAVPDAETALRPDAARSYPAVALFLERATAQRPGFRLTEQNAIAVAQICRRLDGIPLALELAAARTRALAPDEIARRLDDRFQLLTFGDRGLLPRQQTLRALIDWSYDLLTPAESALFRRLSVFEGGWTLAAAEAVCADAPTSDTTMREAQLDRIEVADLLSRLVEKSLVLAEEDAEGGLRYRFLETIQSYARDRLAASAQDPPSGEPAAARQRHLLYFRQMAEEAEARLHTAQQTAQLARLEIELDNLRGALAWALHPAASTERRIQGLRLAGALELFWLLRGHVHEARSLLGGALAAVPPITPVAVLGKVYAAAGTMAWAQSDYVAAERWHQAALACFRQADLPARIARSLSNLAVSADDRGRGEEANALHAEAVAMARRSGDPWIYATVLNNQGARLLDQGRASEATAILEQALALYRQAGEPTGQCYPLFNLAELAIAAGAFDRAAALLDELTPIVHAAENPRMIAATLEYRGLLHLRQRQFRRAGVFYRQSLRYWAELGDKRSTIQTLEGAALTMPGSGHLAVRLLGAAAAQRDVIGAPLPPAAQAEIMHALTLLHDELGDAIFAAAWRAGGTLSLAEAVAAALQA